MSDFDRVCEAFRSEFTVEAFSNVISEVLNTLSEVYDYIPLEVWEALREHGRETDE